MGFFAKIDENNVVTDLVHVDSDSDENASIYLEQVLGLEGPWINARTATNTANYGAKGYVYLDDIKVFMPPKPFNSWSVKKNEISSEYYWSAPISYPEDEGYYVWDEDSLSWVLSE